MALDVIKQIRDERNRLQKEVESYKKKLQPLLKEIKNLDRALDALGSKEGKVKGKRGPVKAGAKKVKIKDAILDNISQAGSNGVTARDIINSIGKARQNTIRTTLNKMIKDGNVNYNDGKYIRKSA